MYSKCIINWGCFIVCLLVCLFVCLFVCVFLKIYNDVMVQSIVVVHSKIV